MFAALSANNWGFLNDLSLLNPNHVSDWFLWNGRSIKCTFFMNLRWCFTDLIVPSNIHTKWGALTVLTNYSITLTDTSSLLFDWLNHFRLRRLSLFEFEKFGALPGKTLAGWTPREKTNGWSNPFFFLREVTICKWNPFLHIQTKNFSVNFYGIEMFFQEK